MVDAQVVGSFIALAIMLVLLALVLWVLCDGACRPGSMVTDSVRLGYRAEVVLDSVSPAGKRITTMTWRYWRMIHAEVMTYRMLSRNASSSRAIPIKVMMRQVLHDPAGPVWWGRNQSGMKARSELTGWRRAVAIHAFFKARYAMLAVVWLLSRLPLHKQVANRLLEPWMWITVVITATEWDHVWRQRVHPDAQPEFRYIATVAKMAYSASRPVTRVTHAPFLRQEDYFDLVQMGAEKDYGEGHELPMRVSTARSARVSYLTHLGVRDIREDLRLHDDLVRAQPPHTSPFEHPATAMEHPYMRSGNFFGWRQYREDVDPHFIHADGSPPGSPRPHGPQPASGPS